MLLYVVKLLLLLIVMHVSITHSQEISRYSNKDKTISVTGCATLNVVPDLVHITFGVEVNEKTAKKALISNSISMDKVLNSLKDIGIVDTELSTSQFTIYPMYNYYQEQGTGKNIQELTGYTVSNIIIVKTKKLDSVASIIDNAVTAGVNKVDSVHFSSSPTVYMQLKDDLLAAAVLNAKEKATNALAPLDCKIIGVKDMVLSEAPDMHQYKSMRNSRVAYEGMDSSSPATSIFSSNQDISTSVHIVFLIGTA